MKKVRYRVAMSLDGYIAGPNGEYNWITRDPEVNFAEIWAQFDTLLMGRRTYEPAIAAMGKNAFKGMETFVVSHSLKQADHPHVTIVSEPTRNFLTALRSQSQKDVWLFGGGELFRTLLAIGEVDTVEVSIVPVMLGRGIPLLPPSTQQTKLKLTSHRIYPSGLVALVYEVPR
jgi:dihydrofolate reductase